MLPFSATHPILTCAMYKRAMCREGAHTVYSICFVSADYSSVQGGSKRGAADAGVNS